MTDPIGSYKAGMVAPGENIVWWVLQPWPNDVALDLTTASEIVLEVLAEGETGRSVQLNDWIISNVEATRCKATLLPTGEELRTLGSSATFTPTLIVDGVVFRYEPRRENIRT